MAIAIMAALYSFPAVRAADARPLLFGFSITQLIIFTAFGAAFVTGIASIIRAGRYSLRLILHIVFSAGIGAVLVWQTAAPILFQTAIITFYNVLFIESLLSATNEKRKEGLPDFFVPATCPLYFIIPQYTLVLMLLQTLYLFVRIVVRFTVFFNRYKSCWHWKNEKAEN